MQHELVEGLVRRGLVQTKIMFQLRGLDQRPDLAPQRGHLGRIHGQHLGVLVEQLLQPGDVAVGLGAGHRGHQMVDDRGVRAALGLGALPRIVDQERIDQRQRPDRRIGAAGRGHADVLARQPFQVAVLAEVDHRVRAELPLDPAVDRQVVVRRSKIRIVVDRDRVLAEPARRLHQDHDVAGLEGGRHDLAVGVAGSDRRTARPAPRPRPRSPPRQDHPGARPANADRLRPGSGPAGRSAVPGSAIPGPARRRRSARGSARCRRWCRAARPRPARARRCRGSRRVRRGRSPPRAWPGAAGSPRPGCPARPRCRSGSAWSDTPRARSRSCGPRPGCAAAGRG